MALAVRLLKEGRGDALISCGNTGALFTCASLVVRRIRGVRRAVLAAVVPLDNAFVICDSGANTEATPEMLVQFAAMGSIYAKNLLGYESPRVALLNNGSEETKGTELQQKAFELLRQTKLNFIGNCEGAGDLPADFCDVVVCDGFIGNIALKTIEGHGQAGRPRAGAHFQKRIRSRCSATCLPNAAPTPSAGSSTIPNTAARLFWALTAWSSKAHGSAKEKAWPPPSGRP